MTDNEKRIVVIQTVRHHCDMALSTRIEAEANLAAIKAANEVRQEQYNKETGGLGWGRNYSTTNEEKRLEESIKEYSRWKEILDFVTEVFAVQ